MTPVDTHVSEASSAGAHRWHITSDHRPELLDRWEVLRAAKEDGQVIFTFLFYGGEAAEWQMESILVRP